MFPELLVLIVGIGLGACLRLPAFMGATVFVVAAYGWASRHDPLEVILYDVLVGLVAIQCGYALTIVARLLFKSVSRRLRSRPATENPERSPR